MKTAERLDRLPPYLFAELERKIAAQRAAGVDVISLGIGDPDTPTPELTIDALAVDPGYPVYTGGPLLAGGEVELMPLLPERGFTPDLLQIPAEVLGRARLMYLNYPNNPTGAVAPAGFFQEVVAFAQDHDFLVVH